MISMEAYGLYLMEVEIRISYAEWGTGLSCASSRLTNSRLALCDKTCYFAAESTDPSA